MKQVRLFFRCLSLALFALSIWLAWPMIMLRDYPHVTLRSYAALLVMALAGSGSVRFFLIQEFDDIHHVPKLAGNPTSRVPPSQHGMSFVSASIAVHVHTLPMPN